MRKLFGPRFPIVGTALGTHSTTTLQDTAALAYSSGAVSSYDGCYIHVIGGTRQVETATVAEAVPGTLTAGNATVIVTAAGMHNSPKTLSVALATNDSENTVATKVRAALSADDDVMSLFSVSGATTAVILTRRVPSDFRIFLARHADLLMGVDEWTLRMLVPRRFWNAVALHRFAVRDTYIKPLF